jgi:hypothetical protein
VSINWCFTDYLKQVEEVVMTVVIVSGLGVERGDHRGIETGDENPDPGQEIEKEGKLRTAL